MRAYTCRSKKHRSLGLSKAEEQRRSGFDAMVGTGAGAEVFCFWCDDSKFNEREKVRVVNR